jgi:hypothetical protein
MTRRKSKPVNVVKPHTLVWREALQLAGGDAKRIEIRSATEVVVKN